VFLNKHYVNDYYNGIIDIIYHSNNYTTFVLYLCVKIFPVYVLQYNMKMSYLYSNIGYSFMCFNIYRNLNYFRY